MILRLYSIISIQIMKTTFSPLMSKKYVSVTTTEFFCNRSSHILPDKNNEHQTITYRSFKNFDQSCFLNDLSTVPWEIIENFDTVDDIVSVWTLLFTEVLDKHAPISNHKIKRKYQPEWLSFEILDLMKERNKHKLNGNTDAYKAEMKFQR